MTTRDDVDAAIARVRDISPMEEMPIAVGIFMDSIKIILDYIDERAR